MEHCRWRSRGSKHSWGKKKEVWKKQNVVILFVDQQDEIVNVPVFAETKERTQKKKTDTEPRGNKIIATSPCVSVI